MKISYPFSSFYLLESQKLLLFSIFWSDEFQTSVSLVTICHFLAEKLRPNPAVPKIATSSKLELGYSCLRLTRLGFTAGIWICTWEKRNLVVGSQ